MPMYSYECQVCHHIYDISKSVSSRDKLDTLSADVECPHCHKVGQSKRIWPSSIGIIFKGTGWYVTDYKSKPSS